MAIRLIALDIDGTLSESGDRISPRNLSAISRAQEAGIYVTLATGRNLLASKPIWSQLHVAGPSIHYGGAWIADTRTGETLFVDALAPEAVRTILDVAYEMDVHAQLYQGDTVLYEKPNAFAEAYCTRFALPFEIDPLLRNRHFTDVPKVLAYADPNEEPRVRKALEERLHGVARVSRSQPGFIELNAVQATKGRALERLAGILGVSRSETAAIGDSYLDMPMLEWAGVGVCVADGVPDALALADVIVPGCAEDGVAEYIERYVLDR